MQTRGYRLILSLFSLLLFYPYLAAQRKVIDQIVAVLGDEVVLQSDIESQYMQLMAQGYKYPGDIKCELLEELMIQKLLLNQAEIDSIVISESMVEMQLDQRLNYFIRQIGSREKLEAYFNKSTLEIKEDFRDIIKEQLITQQMQSNIINEVHVTPSDVRKYYQSLSKDSLPYINATIQIRQILLYPPYSEDAVFEVKERLLELRKRIVEGKSFAALAVLYSECPSATKGGELGYMSKSEMDKEYARVAYGLKKGGISKIVKTDFGYHLIQLIDRQEDRINTRHILMKPKTSLDITQMLIRSLDSIASLIRMDSMTFEQAAMKFSQDKKSRLNGGLVINPVTGNTRFHMDDFATKDYYVLRDLKLGEMSEPYESEDDKGNKVYKIIMLANQSEPHVANLEEDYNIIKEMAEEHYKYKALRVWITDKQKSTYIKIDDSFKNCTFLQNGWIR